MKEMLAALLAALLSLSPAVQAVPGDAPPKAALCMSSLSDPWEAGLCAAMEDAARGYGLEPVRFDAAHCPDTQFKQVAACAAGGYGVIAVTLVDYNLAQGLAQAAGDVPLIFVNTPVYDGTVLAANRRLYVGTVDSARGEALAELLERRFPATPSGGAPRQVDVLLLTGLGDASRAAEEAFRSRLKADGWSPSITEAAAGWDRACAYERTAGLLRDGARFDAAVALNDVMALGAAQAFADAGYAPGAVPIFGVDGTEEAVQAVADGVLYATAYKDRGALAREAMRQAARLAAHDPSRDEAQAVYLPRLWAAAVQGEDAPASLSVGGG
ncbi:sugar ABC transporter substrate-binding protein [Intestinibacillus massiliensis]|nr:sugar ABC transporter substrate-binding protein [Intestinibacillus massiliensis]